MRIFFLWLFLYDNIKPTKDDEGQLQPDNSQPVEQEGSDDASNVTQSGTNWHSKVPTVTRTTS